MVSRHVLWVGVLFLLFSVVVSATAGTGSYSTNMYPKNGDKDFVISGGYETHFVGQRIDILFTYNVKYTNKEFNTTKMTVFTAKLRNASGHVLAEKKLPKLSMTKGEETGLKGSKISVVAAPDDIDHIWYVINHTMKQGGKTFSRQVTGGFKVDVPERAAFVKHFGTNVTDVLRGQRIYVNGTSQSIDSMNISGQPITVPENGMFHGWIRVPIDKQEGLQNVTFRLETDEGVFNRHVLLNVSNSPPSLTLHHPQKIQEGSAFHLRVDATDDVGVANTTVTFQGKPVTPSGDTYNFPTTNLPTGKYPFTVSATDVAGATTTAHETVVIVKHTTNTGGTSNTGTNEKTQHYSKNESFIISVIDTIRGFIKNLLFNG